MAKRGVSQVEDFVVFDNPPSNDVNSCKFRYVWFVLW